MLSVRGSKQEIRLFETVNPVPNPQAPRFGDAEIAPVPQCLKPGSGEGSLAIAATIASRYSP